MRSVADHIEERERMASFRKEALLLQAVGAGAQGVTGLGKGIWRGAKAIGGGRTMGGVGTLAAGATLAGAAPVVAHQMAKQHQEDMAPWQGRRTVL